MNLKCLINLCAEAADAEVTSGQGNFVRKRKFKVCEIKDDKQQKRNVDESALEHKKKKADRNKITEIIS